MTMQMYDQNNQNTHTHNLYAFYLQLRPLQHGTLMPFNGELVHAAWLDWLRSAAPDIATRLHEGNKRRLFTCSSLQFPFSARKMREAELHNTHLPLDPTRTYMIRITLLLGELFPIFARTLLNPDANEQVLASRPPFLQLSKQSFLLEGVISGEEDSKRWTGINSFHTMVEEVKQLQLGKTEHLELEFASLTTFSRGSAKQKDYGNHHARLPLPQYVFPGLAKRWQELAPPEYAGLVQRERIEEYTQHEGIFISDYNLRAHQVKFTTHIQPGFIGTCKYTLRGSDEPTSANAPLTIRQQLILLAKLAFYSGIGYKTAMGMGQARIILN
jgi:CRISPR-associated endoribonuclease Cas6